MSSYRLRSLLKEPTFVFGLWLRLSLLVSVMPRAAVEWYVPFLEVTTQQATIDPWRVFVASGGTPAAFPYGYVMWLVLSPMTVLCRVAGVNRYLGYGLTLLATDIALLWVLGRLFRVPYRTIRYAYWLSPIVLFATYWLGLNDLIPMTILCIALLAVRWHRLGLAGVLCGAAISAKLSMVLAVPFFGIYLFRNRGLQHLLWPYLAGLLGTSGALGFHFALSAEAVHMLLKNPEMGKVYQLAVRIGDGVPLYVLPMAYLFMVYLAWQIRRMSFDLFVVLQGLAFFLVLLLSPAAPGWFIWIIPLLVFYQISSGRVAVFLVGSFTAAYVAVNFLTTPRPLLAGCDVANSIAYTTNRLLGVKGLGLLHTVLFTFGFILMIRIWREVVRKSEYFRLSRKPLVVGISGDSGSGKDTLVESLAGVFGSHSLVAVSGDDYHLWDRQKPMWQVMTPLNPRANNLEQFVADVVDLKGGKAIQSRYYDHTTGTMTRPHRTASNDFIIVSGLHALYIPILRDCYDLSIYLDMDEELRRYLKIQRDVNVRGHSIDKVRSSIERRAEDSKRFIRPQADFADLVISLQPLHRADLAVEQQRHPLRFRLRVRSRYRANQESLVRALVGLCGLHVDIAGGQAGSSVELMVEGDTTADDIALASQSLFPEMNELFDLQPRWEHGVKGLIQLVVISHVNEALQRRLI